MFLPLPVIDVREQEESETDVRVIDVRELRENEDRVYEFDAKLAEGEM